MTRTETQIIQQTITRVEASMYSFIGDAGAVTAAEVEAFTGLPRYSAEVWLRDRADAGYLHRDEFGRYGTSCAWPRVGF